MCHLIPVLITGALLELLAGLWLVSHSMGMIGLALAPRRFYVNGDGHLSDWYWGALSVVIQFCQAWWAGPLRILLLLTITNSPK
jgi:hypothetical protein